jgi:WD40 repeat protein
LAVTSALNDRGDFRIVSGGVDGQVRVWKITKNTQNLEHALKEHKGTVMEPVLIMKATDEYVTILF